jgi:adenine-specific DNA-methyltransferase
MEVVVKDHPIAAAERRRLDAGRSLDRLKRAALGQFFTPAPAASLIASMLTGCEADRVRLLDPGAGTGSLTAAAVEHFARLGIRELEVVAWEIDPQLHPLLRGTLEHCAGWAAEQGLTLHWDLRGGDYIEATAAALAGELGTELERFEAIIMNPPYRKVNGGTPERIALERVGLPITNLYTAFLALAAAQLNRDGVLAAITPRSFANGRYAEPFRRYFFERVGIEQLHLFESRTHVFADADVLQENVIFSARRDAEPPKVRLSFSHGAEDAPRVREVPAAEILRPDDARYFLRIPGEEQDTEVAATMTALPSSLEDLGIAVSTGRVVEFRAREHLRMRPEPGAAPLVRPNHLKDSRIHWPDSDSRGKPSARAIDPASEKLLLPNGTYVVVKRLTAKEEARRVRAAVSDPTVAPGQWIAFENHLNVFHRGNRSLPDDLAHGLAAYLNSSFVDCYVRQFNGHTQVNATDLRHLRYPSAERLVDLGAAAMRDRPIAQEEVDALVAPAVGDLAVAALPRAA